MRIATISDIHIDINHNYPVIEHLIDYCNKQSIDTLIIGGDLSNHYEQTIQAINDIERATATSVYFVPGNHDLWKSDSHATSTAIYNAYIADRRCLAGKTVYLSDQWALIGDIAWFDYSFGNSMYSHTDFDAMAESGRAWQDQHFNEWCKDNVSTSQQFVERLDKRLAAVGDKQIIFVTHMIAHRYFAVPESREEWRYFNAFLGSEHLSALAIKHRVRYHIMGHVHYRKRLVSDGVDFICACLNYHKQWRSHDVVAEIADAMVIIDI